MGDPFQETIGEVPQAFIAHIIIGIAPQLIIIGMPLFMADIMRSQVSVNIAIDMPSMGDISQVMPLSVIVQVMVAIIMGMAIIGMAPIIGICIGIIDILDMGMPIIGAPPIMFGIIGDMAFIISGLSGLGAALIAAIRWAPLIPPRL